VAPNVNRKLHTFFDLMQQLLSVAAISFKQWGDDMASAEREPITGGLGQSPWSGVQGAKPPWSWKKMKFCGTVWEYTIY